jgi:hypothetical protein
MGGLGGWRTASSKKSQHRLARQWNSLHCAHSIHLGGPGKGGGDIDTSNDVMAIGGVITMKLLREICGDAAD